MMNFAFESESKKKIIIYFQLFNKKITSELFRALKRDN